MRTRVEIVDIAPPNTDTDSISKTDVSAGVTELSKDELFRLFQLSSLALTKRKKGRGGLNNTDN
jgi:hypothetical protein